MGKYIKECVIPNLGTIYLLNRFENGIEILLYRDISSIPEKISTQITVGINGIEIPTLSDEILIPFEIYFKLNCLTNKVIKHELFN